MVTVQGGRNYRRSRHGGYIIGGRRRGGEGRGEGQRRIERHREDEGVGQVIVLERGRARNGGFRRGQVTGRAAVLGRQNEATTYARTPCWLWRINSCTCVYVCTTQSRKYWKRFAAFLLLDLRIVGDVFSFFFLFGTKYSNRRLCYCFVFVVVNNFCSVFFSNIEKSLLEVDEPRLKV